MPHPLQARVVAHGVVVHPGHRMVMLRHLFLGVFIMRSMAALAQEGCGNRTGRPLRCSR
jgi:hypothetical protein